MRLIKLIATAGGAGFAPVAPGTVGSVVGVALFVAVRAVGGAAVELGVLVVLTGLGVWTAGTLERSMGTRDPGVVVIDEVVGMLLTLLWLPVGWVEIGLGFVLFRALDVLKPFPARRLEALPGGWGIVLDDLAAGLYAQLLLRAWLVWGPA